MRRLAASITFVACAAATACTQNGDASGAAEKVTVGWLAKGATNTFFDVSRHAAELAARDLSSASGNEVEVVLLDPMEDTPEAQVLAAEAAIDEGKIDALGVSVLSPELMTPVIDRAAEAGIPVLTFDSDAPSSKRLTFYGISNRAGAETAARTLADLMGQQGKIAIMTAAGSTRGTLSSSQTYIERMSGFEETIAGYPNLEIVSVTTCGKDDEANKAGCTQILEEVVAEHPDVTGFYLARGRVLREAELETLAPSWSAKIRSGEMKVVGFDAPEDALHSVRDGLVHALITQDYFGWGYDVVNLSYDVVAFGRELETFTDSQFDVVCANNISELMEMWEVRDFRSELEDCDIAR
ncbi:MAG TPA: substrate-binding domain-containing protein [Polyangiaceae bacterium]